MARSTKAGDYPRLRPGSLRRRTLVGASCRSTKAGDYPRLRRVRPRYGVRADSCAQRRPEITPGYDTRALGPVDSGWGRPAQRRPEITPGYDAVLPSVRADRPGGRSTKAGDYPRLRLASGHRLAAARPPRSTKAGDYPRLRPRTPDDAWYVRFVDAQRRPEITPGYDSKSSTPSAVVRRDAQRRPEITPGYDPAARALDFRPRPYAQRRPEITPGYDAKIVTVRARSSLRAQRRPEITPGYDRRPRRACDRRALLRSTKAGDYPRLRRRRTQPTESPTAPAQRRPEITPGYDPPRPSPAPPTRSLNEGRRLPPATTRTATYRAPPYRMTLNEGRRLPPATTRTATYRAPPYRMTLNEGRRLPPATTALHGGGLRRRALRSTKAGDYPRLRPDDSIPSESASSPGAQRRPEITPGYDLGAARGLPRRSPRSTKAGDYPRLRPPAAGVDGAGEEGRSTKAGDYPRLRRAKRSWASLRLTTLNEGRRLPPATTRPPPVRSRPIHVALNEGRRLPPATTRRAIPSRPSGRPALNEGRRLPPATTTGRTRCTCCGNPAQRRPEITPGYDEDAIMSGGPPWHAQRRPEITPGYDALVQHPGRVRERSRSTKAGDYPRLRPGVHRLERGERSRSTKAGDYPRLRRSGMPIPSPFGLRAQRRPEITPGYDGHSTQMPRLRRVRAQRRPEITPGYDHPTRTNRQASPALNEGRRLPPATTRRLRHICPPLRPAQRRPEITPGYDGRQTRIVVVANLALNEGRRLPPATTRPSGSTARHSTAPLNEGRRLPPATTAVTCKPGSFPGADAQRRPEITPGYDPGRRGRWRKSPGPRSTKAGDYPRLRPGGGEVRKQGEPPRSTKAGDYPRLRPLLGCPLTPAAPLPAQRRPEITPGYDLESARCPRPGRTSLNEGRRLPPATTVRRLGQVSVGVPRSTKAGDYPRLRRAAASVRDRRNAEPAQRRPEITPGYDPLSGCLNPPEQPLNEGRRLPPATTARSDAPPFPSAPNAQRRPEITPGYDALLSSPSIAGGTPAQRRPEITPGYDPGTSPRPREAHRRSTKAGDYPRLRPPHRPRREMAVDRSTKAGDYPRLRHRARRGAGRSARALNEGRRLPPATTSRSPNGPSPIPVRSTKAGDYPRLRREGRSRLAHPVARRSTKAGDYPRLRRLAERGAHVAVTPLNEGRRLPPATTRTPSCRAARRGTLNEGRRLPPATTRSFNIRGE